MADEIKSDEDIKEGLTEALEERLEQMRAAPDKVDGEGEPIYPEEKSDGDDTTTTTTKADAGADDAGGETAVAPVARGEGDTGDGGGDGEAGAGVEATGEGDAGRSTDPDPGTTDGKGDTLPEGLSDRAQKRFQDLSARASAAEDSFNRLKQANDTLYKHLNAAQATPEQLETALAMIRADNSGDFSGLEKHEAAFRQVNQRVRLGMGLQPDMAGPAGAQEDLLAHFPDLQKAVDELEVTREYALELGTQRLRGQQQEHYRTQQRDASAQTQAYETAATTAAHQIKDWELHVSGADPDFKSKQDLLMKSAKKLMGDMHPNQWLPELQRQYAQINDWYGSQAAARKGAPTPLRASATSNASDTNLPEDPVDRMQAQLDRMRGVA